MLRAQFGRFTKADCKGWSRQQSVYSSEEGATIKCVSLIYYLAILSTTTRLNVFQQAQIESTNQRPSAQECKVPEVRQGLAIAIEALAQKLH